MPEEIEETAPPSPASDSPESPGPRDRETTFLAARLGLMAAAVLAIVGLYYVVTPVIMVGNSGALNCGRAITGPPNDFAMSYCRDLVDTNFYSAGAALLSALVVAWLALRGDPLTRRLAQPPAPKPLDDDEDW